MLVLYNGREVESEHFRAFVYGADGQQMLANSWDEYQRLLASGDWIAFKENVSRETIAPPKRQRKKVKHDNGS